MKINITRRQDPGVYYLAVTQFGCYTCRQLKGRPCLNRRGVRCAPHSRRLANAEKLAARP